MVALYNRTLAKAEGFARQFNVPHVHDNVDALLDRHADELGFVDIITDVDTHGRFVDKAAGRGLDVICQETNGPSLEASRQRLETCRRAGVRRYIHENFRWQSPLRALNRVL